MTDQPQRPGDEQPDPRTFEASTAGEVRETEQPPPVIHTLGENPAPGEQPYFVPTAQQQAWSRAHQNGGRADEAASAGGPGWSAHQYGGRADEAASAGGPGWSAHQYPGQAHQPAQPAGYYPPQYAGQQPTAAYPPAYSGYQPQPYGGQYPTQTGGGYSPPPPGFYPPPAYGYWAPPPAAPKKHKHRFLYAGVAAAVVAALAVGGVALAVDHSHDASQQTSLTTPTQNNPFSGNGSTNPFSGNGSNGSSGNGSNGSSGSTGTTGQATDTQSVGIVDINTTIDFGQGKAAGTGIILSSDGTILTNNHVVESSTAISVTVISTGKTYTAKVVGTDPTDDIAVIKLQNASGLATAKLGDSSKVTVGTEVTAVGNAGGTGGTPSAATGTVTALDQSITASDEDGSNSERLTGMFQVNANIQAGDSGGPLYENAGGTIIGINTAASTSGGAGRFGGTTTGTTGFAIPIAKATSIAQQILNGTDNATIHQGYPAFLGVQLSTTSQTAGAAIAGVIDGSGAANAGLSAGDTITSVDGKAVASSTALSTIMETHNPGDKVKIGYTDANGANRTLTVTLGEGPAD